MQKASLGTTLGAVVLTVSALAGCGNNDQPEEKHDPCAVQNVGFTHDKNTNVIQVARTQPPAPRTPQPPRTADPRPRTQDPRPTATSTGRPRTTTPQPTATATSPATGAPQLSRTTVRPQGELPYRPPVLAPQSAANIRRVVDSFPTLTRTSTYRSPVTNHVYAFHSSAYFHGLNWQDLYNPFDPRNWYNPLSPFHGLAWEEDDELEFQPGYGNEPYESETQTQEALPAETC